MDENINKNKKEKEFLFSFAKINKYFIFPFLCPIFCIICNYFIEKISNDKGVKNKECLLAILECATFTGGGLLYFISFLREKTEETRDKSQIYSERSASIKLIYTDSSLITKKKYIKIFLILFIMALSVSFFDITEVYTFDKNIFEERFYLILFISIFSHLILKIKIYNHQILSLSMALVGFILLFIPTILEITTNDIFINIIFFISSISFSMFLVLIKYLTHVYFISPYLCLLFLGIVSTLLTLIYFFIYSLASYKNLSFIINSFDFSNLDIGNWVYIYIIIILISGSFLQTFSFLVIYYFSPTLFMVTDIMTPFLLWIIQSISKKETVFNKVVNSIGYFIVLIASLIFNEIIICNFCNFNKFTKKYLEKRQKEELILLKQTENENSYYNENDNNNDNENDNNNGNENENNENDSQNENDTGDNSSNEANIEENN